MTHLVLISLTLSAAAWLAERAAAQRGASTRWVWLGAMVASALLPLLADQLSFDPQEVFSPAVSNKLGQWHDANPLQLPYTLWNASGPAAAEPGLDLDALAQALWWAASGLVLTAFAGSAAWVQWRQRRWAAHTVCQTPVLVAPNAGPAVVGWVRPRIVLPQWLLQASPEQQTLVLAHERAHLAARDPQWLGLALLLLVAMPWNLPLWWQWQQLRRAVEVDCDARVLRHGHTLADYGHALITVGQHQSGLVGMTAAMTESQSFLEQRIRIMLRQPPKWARLSALALGGMALALLAVAADVGVAPPAIGAASAQSLARFDGAFRIADNVVMQVTHDGAKVYVQVTGQPKLEVQAKSTDEIVSANPLVEASGRFERDANGRAKVLVWHQAGRDNRFERIDDASAKKINDAVEAKIKTKAVNPASEPALRRMDRQLRQNPVNVDGMSPQMAQLTKQQAEPLRAGLEALGALKSLEFTGVMPNGWDKFLARYENGTMTWQISVDAKGLIVAALVTP